MYTERLCKTQNLVFFEGELQLPELHQHRGMMQSVKHLKYIYPSSKQFSAYRVKHRVNQTTILTHQKIISHDDVIKWKHFPRHWPFVRGIHRSPVNSTHKGQWRGALVFSLICAWINAWIINREAGDLRHHRTHCDVIVMGIILVTVSVNELTLQVVSRARSKTAVSPVL